MEPPGPSNRYCITIAGSIDLVSHWWHITDHSVSYWRLFCAGEFKKDADSGKKGLEPGIDLSFVCSVHTFLK